MLKEYDKQPLGDTAIEAALGKTPVVYTRELSLLTSEHEPEGWRFWGNFTRDKGAGGHHFPAPSSAQTHEHL